VLDVVVEVRNVVVDPTPSSPPQAATRRRSTTSTEVGRISYKLVATVRSSLVFS
jgi:hypothetical protein